MIDLIAATRLDAGRFATESALGRSLQRLQHDQRLRAHVAFENRVGLPSLYNALIDAGTANDVLLFVHDDVFLDDYFLVDHVLAGVDRFDVIGVAGNRRRVARQPAWLFIDDQLTYDQPNLSGSVAHGQAPFGKISCYGHTGQECELLDGVLLATRRTTLRRSGVRFDPRFKFNFYDMDFCRQARAAGLRLGTWPIAVTHASVGAFGGPDWAGARALYREKWPD